AHQRFDYHGGRAIEGPASPGGRSSRISSADLPVGVLIATSPTGRSALFELRTTDGSSCRTDQNKKSPNHRKKSRTPSISPPKRESRSRARSRRVKRSRSPPRRTWRCRG